MNSESTARDILAILEDDAKASYTEIAERADVSKPTVRKYVRELEDDGVIVGYSADVDPKKLTDRSIALVGIDLESERYVGAIQTLKAADHVETLYTSSGDHTLMAEVRACDGDQLGAVIDDEILTVEGVEAAHPAVLQERLK